MRLDAPPVEALVSQHTTASITLGGAVLASGIPVSGGRVAVQVDQDVPESVDLTLPHEHEQFVLDPTRPGSVLGHFGHRLHLSMTLTDGGRVWVLPMGSFVVDTWDTDGAGVRVKARGLLALVRGHEAPEARPVGSRTLAASVLAGILREDGLDVVTHTLPQSEVGAEFAVERDRFASAQALAAAIPAVVRQAWDGSVHVRPAPTSVAPVLSWSDGPGGVLVTPEATGSRDGLFNHVVVHWARGEGEDATAGFVEQRLTSGNLAASRFGTVTRRIESDSISGHAQAQLVATNEIARAHLRARTESLTMAADFRVEVDDPVALMVRGEALVGRVTGVEYPLTPADGDMAVTVGIAA